MDHQELRKAGLKVTGPRQKILSILENTPTRHLSAEDIYRILLEMGDDIGYYNDNSYLLAEKHGNSIYVTKQCQNTTYKHSEGTVIDKHYSGWLELWDQITGKK